MDLFKASTQYTDMSGTIAADVADFRSLSLELRSKGRLGEEEYVAGMSFYFHSPDHVSLEVLVTSLDDRKALREAVTKEEELTPDSLRKLSVKTDLKGFFAYFKRVSIKLADKSLEHCLDHVDTDSLPDDEESED